MNPLAEAVEKATQTAQLLTQDLRDACRQTYGEKITLAEVALTELLESAVALHIRISKINACLQ